MECLVLYSGEGCPNELKELLRLRGMGSPHFRSLAKIRDFKELFKLCGADMPVIISGSDSCINEFVNKTQGISLENPIYYFPCGRSQDFFHELLMDSESPGVNPQCLKIDGLLKELPVVSIKGRDFRFVNGVSCGIDELCDSLMEKKSKQKGRRVGLNNPALKKAVFDFEPCNICLNADGVNLSFKNVRLASCLRGCCLSNMELLPQGDAQDGMLKLVLFHSCSRLKAAMLYKKLLKGQYKKLKNSVTIIKGHDISLHFDRKLELKMDGIRFKGADSYRVRSNKTVKQAMPAMCCIPESSAESIC